MQKFYNFSEFWFKVLEIIAIYSFIALLYLQTHDYLVLILQLITHIILTFYLTYKFFDYLAPHLIDNPKVKSRFLPSFIFILCGALIWVVINHLLKILTPVVLTANLL